MRSETLAGASAVVVAAVLGALPAVQGAKVDLGCFADNPGERALSGASKTWADGKKFSPGKCKKFCDGFKYYGVQNGNECYCGDDDYDTYGPSDQCNTLCSGKSNKYCGGPSANRVFMNFEGYSPEGEHEYMGCYKDVASDRALSGKHVTLGDTNSPETCNAECQGFEFFGLQDKGECFCGDGSFGKYKKLKEKKCYQECPGDDEFNCGAPFKNSVHKVVPTLTIVPGGPSPSEPNSVVTPPATPPAPARPLEHAGFEYMGCFHDEYPRDLSGEDQISTSNSLETCNAFCAAGGFEYFGVQFGEMCSCSNSYGAYGESGACNMECTGDDGQVCGGSWANSVYLTKAIEEPSTPNVPAPTPVVELPTGVSETYDYKGCWTDNHDRDMGATSMESQTLTPAECNLYCTEHKYNYFALQYRSQCFCGNAYGKHGPSTFCTTPCSGDSDLFCGGGWANSVYESSHGAAAPVVLAPAPTPEPTASPIAPTPPIGLVTQPPVVVPANRPPAAAQAGLPPNGPRQLIFENRCSFEVRVGHTGGRANQADNGVCPINQVWDPATNGCHWTLPLTDDQTYLNGGASIAVSLPDVPGTDMRWSGNVWGSTGCDRTTGRCKTGVCGAGNCPAFTGPGGPVTKAEFTFSDNFADFYDISNIDGVNVPMAMRPDDREGTADAEDRGADRFWCGNPGDAEFAKFDDMPGCTWEFDPTIDGIYGNTNHAQSLRWVDTESVVEGSSCVTDNDCSGDFKCGAHNAGLGAGTQWSFQQGVCGTPIGWWSGVSICGGVSHVDAPYNCRMETGQGSQNFGELYGCGGEFYSQSGYQPNAPDTVCGCPIWNDEGVAFPVDHECSNTNPVWMEYALPFCKYIKKACPTAYTFAYDDATSTFVCTNGGNNGGVNDMSYVITFCPDDSERAYLA